MTLNVFFLVSFQFDSCVYILFRGIDFFHGVCAAAIVSKKTKNTNQTFLKTTIQEIITARIILWSQKREKKGGRDTNKIAFSQAILGEKGEKKIRCCLQF